MLLLWGLFFNNSRKYCWENRPRSKSTYRSGVNFDFGAIPNTSFLAVGPEIIRLLVSCDHLRSRLDWVALPLHDVVT